MGVAGFHRRSGIAPCPEGGNTKTSEVEMVFGRPRSRRFLKPTMIDFNGLELNQASVRVITNQAAIAGLERISVRNLSGSTSDPRKVGLFSKAPYYVFRRPV